MNKFFSIENSHVIFGVLCLILFSVQSYLFVTKNFNDVLMPFAEHPQILSFVQAALWGVWLKMLIWPILLFLVLVLTIFRMKKHNG